MMNDTCMRQIRLIPDQLNDKESMARTMKEAIDPPEWFGGNLDALADVLSEISSETVFEVEICDLDRFAQEGYPKKVLEVICASAQDNPHLHVYLTDRV